MIGPDVPAGDAERAAQNNGRPWEPDLHRTLLASGASCGRGRSTCAILGGMTTVGLRELRQDASDLVRRVEDGEEIEITVAGRLAARLVPAAPRRWQRWVDIADLFAGRPDPDWDRDRDLIDQSVANPWEHDDEGNS
jgi:prevent-host-death family protein